MDWKQYLLNLEHKEQWDDAIEYMQFIIESDPNDMNAYIYMNFLIMNLLVEEDYDESKHDYYAALLKKYFDESYAKFSNNAEYLFCTGITAIMSEWHFGITVDDNQKMLKRAMELDSDNILYKDIYYLHLDKNVPNQLNEVLDYARLILQDDSVLVKLRDTHGAFGEYFYIITSGWAKRILRENSK